MREEQEGSRRVASRAWHSVSPESPIVDLTLLASILSFVCVAVSETLKQLS